MSAGQIIDAFKQLPAEEQARVADFVREFGKNLQLSGNELEGLAEELIQSDDAGEKSKLREEIAEGFYGN